MIPKILKDIGVYGFASYLPKVASFLIYPIITPNLTTEDFGIFGVTMAFITLFEIFYTLGLNVNLGNAYIQYPGQYKWFWRQIYGFLLQWGIVYCLLLSTVLYFVLPQELGDNLYVIILLQIVPIVLFGPATELGSYFCIYSKKSVPVATRGAIFGTLYVVLTLVFIRYYDMGYMGWFWSLGIVSFCTKLSWLPVVLFKEKITPIFNYKRATIKKALKIGAPMMLNANGSYLLSQSDRIMMSALKLSSTNIGLYSAAYTVGNLLETINSSYITAVQPYIYDYLRAKEELKLRNLIFSSQILYYFFILIFALFSEEIIGLLFRNPEFKNLHHLATLIVIAFASKPMYTTTALHFYYYEKTKILSLHTYMAGGINVLLNLLFIPIWGIEAAAISTIVGYYFLAYSKFFTKEFRTMSTQNYYPTRWIIGSSVLYTLVYSVTFLEFSSRMSILGVLLMGVIGLYLQKHKIITFLNGH